MSLRNAALVTLLLRSVTCFPRTSSTLVSLSARQRLHIPARGAISRPPVHHMAAIQAGPGDLPPQKRRKLELTDEEEIATLLDGTPIDADWLQVALAGLIGRGVLIGGLAIDDQVTRGILCTRHLFCHHYRHYHHYHQPPTTTNRHHHHQVVRVENVVLPTGSSIMATGQSVGGPLSFDAVVTSASAMAAHATAAANATAAAAVVAAAAASGVGAPQPPPQPQLQLQLPQEQPQQPPQERLTPLTVEEYEKMSSKQLQQQLRQRPHLTVNPKTKDVMVAKLVRDDAEQAAKAAVAPAAGAGAGAGGGGAGGPTTSIPANAAAAAAAMNAAAAAAAAAISTAVAQPPTRTIQIVLQIKKMQAKVRRACPSTREPNPSHTHTHSSHARLSATPRRRR